MGRQVRNDANHLHGRCSPVVMSRRREYRRYFPRAGFVFLPDVLRAIAARMSALNLAASTFSPSRMSIARLVFPSRLELKSLPGSFNEAPFANVSFTTDLYASPVQMIPSCDHVGV